MKIETENLIIRDLQITDVESLTKYANNLNVSRYLARIPYPLKKEQEMKFVQKCIDESKKEKRENYQFGISLKNKNEVIGMIGLTNLKEEVNSMEIGYWLGEDYWRKGIMLEAIRKMLDFGFNNLKLNRIEAKAFVENEASKKILEKSGFKLEGLLRQAGHSRATNKIGDDYVFAILKSDWKNKI